MHLKILWLAAGVVLAASGSFLLPPSRMLPPAVPTASAAAFGSLPAYFEPGRADGEFVARRAGLSLTLDGQGANVHLARDGQAATLGLLLEGAEPRAARPENRLPGVSNYFLGEDPRAWRTGVPHYARVRYEEVYPGIDLVYYGNGGSLEYDFLVGPGADPAHIRMIYQGAGDMRIESNGDLRIDLGSGALVHRKPVSWQTLADGTRRPVDSEFELRDGVVTFNLGDWDRELPLVIDPVLSFATFFGGNNDDEYIQGIHVDAAGDIYIAGNTNSSDLPVSAGAYQSAPAALFDLFVAKLDSTGSTVLYCTYLGGNDLDELHQMRVDAAGNVYLAGQTSSTNFPVTAGAPQPTFGGIIDIVLAKLDPTGTMLLYSTYVGGSGGEPGSNMLGGFQIDAAGNAWVYSDTDSSDYPVTAGAPQTSRANPDPLQFDQDAVLTGLNAAGNAFLFSTYHGGTGIEEVGDFNEEGHLFELDGTSAWVAGSTQSDNLPVTAGAFDTTFNGPVGGSDFFVARFDIAAGTRELGTYIGSSGNDLAESLAIDAGGDVYIAGQVATGFPVTAGAADTTYNGGTSDIGIVKLDAAGNELAYATYLGGGAGESAHGLRVDATGAAFVAGSTQSTVFPTTPGAADTTYNGGSNDGFIAKLNPAGSAFNYVTLAGSSDSDGVILFTTDATGNAYALLGDMEGDAFVSAGGFAHGGGWDDYFVKVNVAGTAFLDASYLGGSGDEGSLAMHVDAAENLYLAGITTSANFPATAGTVQPTKPGPGDSEDMFLAKFATTPNGPVVQPGTLALTASTFNVGESGGTASITVARTGGSSGAVSVICTAATAGANTATAGTDYTAASATLNWANGDAANKTCSVAIASDTADEADETFTVTLSNAQGGATLGAPSSAVVSIVDDDDAPTPTPGTVQFNPAAYSSNENGGSVTLTLTRTLGADGAISVSVASGGGSASAGADYTALTQTVSWADGDAAAKTVALPLLDDAVDEPNETVTLTLSNATGGATLGTATATVTLIDDDVVPTPTPTAQPVTVTGRYGKGSIDVMMLGGLLLVLLAVAARRWRAARMAPALAAVLAAVSAQTRAEDGWYAGIRVGVVESTQEAASIERALQASGHDVQVSAEQREPSFTLLGGYRWTSGLAVELGLATLGEFDVEVQGTTEEPEDLLAQTHGLMAAGGRALSAGVAWNFALGERVELTPRVGAYYWESRRRVQNGAAVLRAEDDGVDVAAGITLSLAVGNGWRLGLSGESWAADDRNDLRAWQISLVKTFE